MTTLIVETVSSATNVITFTDVWSRDLVIVGGRWVDDGSFLSGVEAPAGWVDQFYTGSEGIWWDMLAAGATSHTFDVVHATSIQLLGIHLRSDLATGPEPLPTRSGGNDETFVTVGTEDALVGWTFVRDGSIDLTTPDFTLVDQTSHIAVWEHEPLQVPAGTSITVSAYFNTPAAVHAWRRWGGGTAPVVPGVGGWTAWIID